MAPVEADAALVFPWPSRYAVYLFSAVVAQFLQRFMELLPIPTTCLVSTATVATARVACEQSEDQIVVTRDGHHVLTYHKTVRLPGGVEAKYGRSGFIHPIATPSGKVVTEENRGCRGIGSLCRTGSRMRGN